MRFDLISQLREQNPQWPVKALCRIVGVSRSGVSRSGYALCFKRQQQPEARQPSSRPGSSHYSDAVLSDTALMLHIRAAYRRGRFSSGSPRVYDDLREHGIRTSRKRVARLMKQNGLVGRCRARRKVTTTDSRHRLPVAQNLLARRFTPEEVGRPDRFWCGDITYLPKVKAGCIWRWSMTSSRGGLWAGLWVKQWKRVWSRQRGSGHDKRAVLLPIKDLSLITATRVVNRGSQYAGHLFQNLLASSNTQSSTSVTGECLDNAVAESFFGTLKAELLGDQPGRRFAGRRFASKKHTLELVADYIDNFYNLVRRHSALGYKSPIAFEMAHRIK